MHDKNRALCELEQDLSIVIKPADKGGNLIIMNHDSYREMCLKILKDPQGYRILDRDPSETFKSELGELLKLARDSKLIDKN